jgi:hypothetical protein
MRAFAKPTGQQNVAQRHANQRKDGESVNSRKKDNIPQDKFGPAFRTGVIIGPIQIVARIGIAAKVDGHHDGQNKIARVGKAHGIAKDALHLLFVFGDRANRGHRELKSGRKDGRLNNGYRLGPVGQDGNVFERTDLVVKVTPLRIEKGRQQGTHHQQDHQHCDRPNRGIAKRLDRECWCKRGVP